MIPLSGLLFDVVVVGVAFVFGIIVVGVVVFYVVVVVVDVGCDYCVGLLRYYYSVIVDVVYDVDCVAIEVVVDVVIEVFIIVVGDGVVDVCIVCY